MEALTGLIDLLKAGVISPFAFLCLCVLGLVVWGAMKLGDRLTGSVGNLLEVGEKVRQSLAQQITASDARAAVFQQAADLATTRINMLQGDLTVASLRNEHLQARIVQLSADLLASEEREHDLRQRLAGRQPGETL